MLHVFILVGCLTAHAYAGYTHNPYSYSNFPTPIQPAIQYQEYQAPVTYQSFVPQYHQQQYVHQPQVQTYSTFRSIPTIQTAQTFEYQQSFPQPVIYHSTVHDLAHAPSTSTESKIETSETSESTTVTPQTVKNEETTPVYNEVRRNDESVVISAPFRSQNPATSSNIRSQNFEMSADNFRGFAYRNEYEGASSHFVFITGPEAYRAKQFQPQISTRTSASEAVDSVAANVKTSTPDHSLDALIQYLEHPQVGVQRFYSVNNALVSRRIEDEIPTLPVHQFSNIGTTLSEPISPLLPLLRSSFQSNVETVKPTEKTIDVVKEDEQEKHEVSASNIETTSVAPESPTSADEFTTTAAQSTTAATTEDAASTTTTTTTEKLETTPKEEKTTMGTIVVE